MASPKDYIVYIDPDGKTRATVVIHINGYEQRGFLEAEGNKIIGFISSGSEQQAIAYGDQVLR